MANVAISGLPNLPSINGSTLFEVANPNVSSNSVTANQIAQFSANLEYLFLPFTGTIDPTNTVILLQNTLTGIVNTVTPNQLISFRGALVTFNTQHPQSAGGLTISWDKAVYDTSGFWNILNPTIFTVPPGISNVVVRAGLSATSAKLQLLYFNTSNANCFVGLGGPASGDWQYITAHCPVNRVSPGDTFSAQLNIDTGGTTLDNTHFSFFSIEAVP